jgi:hypothetical protein
MGMGLEAIQPLFDPVLHRLTCTRRSVEQFHPIVWSGGSLTTIANAEELWAWPLLGKGRSKTKAHTQYVAHYLWGIVVFFSSPFS